MHDPYEPGLPLATVDPAPIAIPDKPDLAMTPQQSRVDAVAALTTLAISKAATLQLTPDETARLTAEFPDADFLPGAAGKENLIYIQHSALRNRLNSVLGLGQWALIVRESWNEDFATNKGVKGVRVYCRVMMIVRGAYVGEAVGDMDYYPSNGQQNFGDAFEGSKTAAFRRCAKEFGIGLQAWDRHFCDGWWQRKQGKPPQVAHTPRAPQPAPKPYTLPAAPLTTAERREKLAASLKGFDPEADAIFRENGLVLPNESWREISDFTLDRIQPANLLALIQEIKQRKADAEQIPGAEASDQTSTQAREIPKAPDGAVCGLVESTSEKKGEKNGKPWVKYGIKISGVWYNTFSKSDYDLATGLKGREVLFTSEQTQWGSDLKTIQEGGDLIP